MRTKDCCDNVSQHMLTWLVRCSESVVLTALSTQFLLTPMAL